MTCRCSGQGRIISLVPRLNGQVLSIYGGLVEISDDRGPVADPFERSLDQVRNPKRWHI